MFRTLALFCTLAAASLAAAQSTAFTYQGELNESGQLVSGLHDFRFRLFNLPSGGVAVGPQVCVNDVQVSAGRFTANVDFGAAFLTTGDRYLEIDVRTDSGLDCTNTTGFTTLSRQFVAPAPRATAASVANSLASPDGSPANAVNVDNNGKVGIGTTTPTHWLHIATLEPTIAIQDIGAASAQVGYISYRDNANIERAWVGYGSPGDPDFSVINARTGGDIILNTLGGGNIGIGTSSPTAKLEVRGDIRLGSSGEYFASAAEEKLRTVRGTVGILGTVFAGSGWAVTHNATGLYSVTFNTPFSNLPTIVATPGTAGFSVTQNVAFGSVTFTTRNASGVPTDSSVSFIAVGPR
ncbi:MAG: hypothetical protein JSR77_18070 [Planctomycetes bacterium]|nr:hypothetical protein [Planctomycetota bacterium]